MDVPLGQRRLSHHNTLCPSPTNNHHSIDISFLPFLLSHLSFPSCSNNHQLSTFILSSIGKISLCFVPTRCARFLFLQCFPHIQSHWIINVERLIRKFKSIFHCDCWKLTLWTWRSFVFMCKGMLNVYGAL